MIHEEMKKLDSPPKKKKVAAAKPTTNDVFKSFDKISAKSKREGVPKHKDFYMAKRGTDGFANMFAGTEAVKKTPSEELAAEVRKIKKVRSNAAGD